MGHKHSSGDQAHKAHRAQTGGSGASGTEQVVLNRDLPVHGTTPVQQAAHTAAKAKADGLYQNELKNYKRGDLPRPVIVGHPSDMAGMLQCFLYSFKPSGWSPSKGAWGARATRREFWLKGISSLFFFFVMAYLFSLFTYEIGKEVPSITVARIVVLVVFYVYLSIGNISVCIRRCYDVGMKKPLAIVLGALLGFFLLIPISAPFALVLGMWPPQKFDNVYGAYFLKDVDPLLLPK